MKSSAIFAAAIGVLAAAPALADICQTLQASGRNVNKAFTLEYETEQNNYWSTACASLRPRCMLSPNSTQEVADIVAALQETDDQFAVKSGGHMPNNGFASIANGVLISTRNLNQVVYNPDTTNVVVGPGLKWEDIIEGIEETGRTVVGGRMGAVGVGGYLLGGDFLSAQYGWGANNVVNFEIVLANATVVNANATSNQDLFASLKGGGNNFGIVTAFTIMTHPQAHKVWGGNYVFDANKTDEVLAAIRDFTEYNLDDKAAIIPTSERGALLDTWILFLFYDGLEPPAGVFDNFTHIGPIIKTTKTRNYLELVKFNNQFILEGQRYVIATETIPLPNKTEGAEVMQSVYDHWASVTKSVILEPGLISSIAFQPMPRSITSKAKALGGDLMDFETTHDYIVLEFNFSYLFASSDTAIDAATQNLYSGVRNIVDGHVENGLLPDIYQPLFMNDAYSREDYWGRLRTSEKARAVRHAVDPEGFFQTRTSGGFRLA
ncbi:hypothetical protein V493_05951 [Pseudogymnoascus sp. VKM F-4281 (FW-2241)]|nr:hypothetical protein V493_05951 [Pseudogymnoascus sp. VKM F-4281 (FW-2241)]